MIRHISWQWQGEPGGSNTNSFKYVTYLHYFQNNKENLFFQDIKVFWDIKLPPVGCRRDYVMLCTICALMSNICRGILFLNTFPTCYFIWDSSFVVWNVRNPIQKISRSYELYCRRYSTSKISNMGLWNSRYPI